MTEITQAAAEAWQELVEYDDRTSPEEYPDMALITRDELNAFMQRAIDLGRAQALEEAAKVDAGWLVEEEFGDIIHWIALSQDKWPLFKTRLRRERLEMDQYISPVLRVKDAAKALRFARKEDAEAFIALFDRFLLHAKATEHIWDDDLTIRALKDRAGKQHNE
jgi:hypothetical protein